MIQGQVSFYQQTDFRADWDNPTPKQIAESLRQVHAFGRIAQNEINRLTQENRKLQKGSDEKDQRIEADGRLQKVLIGLIVAALGSALVSLCKSYLGLP